jgi:glutathione S-transferase
MLQLYTFAVSHFSEKARWALDLTGASYRETVLLPGPHMVTIRRLAPRTSVPVLAHKVGVIQGSSQIIDYVAHHWPQTGLAPTDPDESRSPADRERWLDREIGARLRRVFYYHALADQALVTALFAQHGPRWARWFYRLGYGAIARAIRTSYAITGDGVAEDMERLPAAAAEVDALMGSRPYLSGDRFGRLDLTLAALAAPLWQPDEHPFRWPVALPGSVIALRDQLDRYRLGEHVRRIYRLHRHLHRHLHRQRPAG